MTPVRASPFPPVAMPGVPVVLKLKGIPTWPTRVRAPLRRRVQG